MHCHGEFGVHHKASAEAGSYIHTNPWSRSIHMSASTGNPWKAHVKASSRRAGEGTVFALLAGESMYVDLSRMYDLPKKTGVLRLSLKGSSSAQ